MWSARRGRGPLQQAGVRGRTTLTPTNEGRPLRSEEGHPIPTLAWTKGVSRWPWPWPWSPDDRRFRSHLGSCRFLRSDGGRIVPDPCIGSYFRTVRRRCGVGEASRSAGNPAHRSTQAPLRDCSDRLERVLVCGPATRRSPAGTRRRPEKGRPVRHPRLATSCTAWFRSRSLTCYESGERRFIGRTAPET